MKKTILTMAGILMMGVVVNAQTDTTLVSPNEMVQGEETNTAVQNPGPANPERVRVQANDLPQGLKQTLTDSQYKGWESAPIYMNKTTNQYSFSLPNNGNTRTYTFDQTGRPVVGATGAAVNSSQSTSQAPSDNSSTYSSRKSATNTTTRSTGGRKTTTQRSTSVKKNNSSGNSSSSTTKGASTTPAPAK